MQEKSSRRSNKERTKSTRAALISAARSLFAEKGYGGTGTPEIARAAKVTRGALYHHFTDKTDLFRAVLVVEAQSIAQQIERETTNPASALDALISGSNAYFSAMAVSGRTRLMLQDGPFVLGHDEIDRIYAKTSHGQLLQGLKLAMAGDETHARLLAPLAEMFSAAFDRAALAISQGQPAGDYKAAIHLLLTRLPGQASTGPAEKS